MSLTQDKVCHMYVVQYMYKQHLRNKNNACINLTKNNNNETLEGKIS